MSVAAPRATPLVRFEGVTKRFGDQVAVDDVSLDIEAGEFFALLGPSGCGKTTLMRMLAGFETPDSGRILLAGQDLGTTPPHKRALNMMFQSYALFPHMSVEKNIAFGLKMERLPKAEIETRVAEMLALTRLEPYARRRPDQLSGGQRQRVALARALAKRPKVLLLDEPLGALDKKLRDETQFELRALQDRLGAAFMIVTHDQDEAMVLADRMAVMQAGKIVQVGPPREVYEHPVSRDVAGFIGDINIFETTVTGVDGAKANLTGGVFAGPVAFSGPAPATGPAALIVRPERLWIGEKPVRGEVSLRGRVAETGYLGDWTTFVVTLESGQNVRIARPNEGDQKPFGRGDAVVVGFDPGEALVLGR